MMPLLLSWYIRPQLDVFANGQRERKQRRIRLAPATLPLREVQKIATEKLRPINQGLETIGSAMLFAEYIVTHYRPLEMPLLAKRPSAHKYLQARLIMG